MIKIVVKQEYLRDIRINGTTSDDAQEQRIRELIYDVCTTSLGDKVAVVTKC